MSKKKKAEEPENLERWLVSYGDFITLLFATFVVLYALAQADVSDFQKIEEALKGAFSTQGELFDGKESLMDGKSDSIFDSQAGANSFVPGLMVEYISPKYESDSFNEIKSSIEELTKNGELSGISSKMTDKGLLLTFDEKYLFAPASAQLNNNSKKILDKIGLLICKKFVLHAMVVEGHTDSNPMRSAQYPSNWELSSARASSVVRYLIDRFKFSPTLFTAVGHADTRPVEDATSPKDPANRRVEILIVKNKYRSDINGTKDPVLNMSKAQQEALQAQRAEVIRKIEGPSISPAAQKLLDENRVLIEKQKKNNVSKNNFDLYTNVDNAIKGQEDNLPKIEKRVIKLDSKIPEDEDFGL